MVVCPFVRRVCRVADGRTIYAVAYHVNTAMHITSKQSLPVVTRDAEKYQRGIRLSEARGCRLLTS